MANGSAHGTQSIDEPQHPLSGVVDTLTPVGVLQLNDTPSAPTGGVDGMHPESAVADEPRHHLLSHSLSLSFIGANRAPLTKGQPLVTATMGWPSSPIELEESDIFMRPTYPMLIEPG